MARNEPSPDPLSDWRAKATFMQSVGATHATWDTSGELLSLTLAARVAIVERPPGPAARMAEFHQAAALERQHNTMFAASRVKPKFTAPAPPPSVVPRAVRAKEEAAKRGESNGG